MDDNPSFERRSFPRVTGIATTAAVLSQASATRPAYAAAMTKAERDKLTPDDIIARMKVGTNASVSAKSPLTHRNGSARILRMSRP